MPGVPDPTRFLKYYLAVILLAWTLLMGAMLYRHWQEENAQVLANARIEARALARQDLLYLEWLVGRGGCYVPAGPGGAAGGPPASRTSPQTVTDDGRVLTRVNPAEVVRQVYRNAGGHIEGHLVSLTPLDPTRLPDSWERRSLEAFRAGAGEKSAVESIEGQGDLLRLIRPLPDQRACRQCHGQDGMPAPATLGGISLAVPLQPFREGVADHQRRVAVFYLAIWGLGVAGLGAGYRRLAGEIHAVRNSELRRLTAEDQLQRLTYYDPLTNLPNRQLFQDRLILALAQAERLQAMLGVVELGLDNFKQVNSGFGHAVGDLVLGAVAERLTSCLRPDDTVARVGEDRFLMLLPFLQRIEDVAKVLDRVRSCLDQPLVVRGQEVFVTASAGIAIFPEDGHRGIDLLRNAASALARAKDMGRSQFQYYAPSMNVRAMEQMALDSGLRRALELDQFELRFQPQVDGRSGEVVGAEALLRWRHPEFGLVPPDQFIPLAEVSGLIFAVGRWVLERACREAVSWQALTGRTIPVAVNLSPRQFQQDDLVEMIEEILQETGLEPAALEIEITEGSLIHNFERAIECVTDLKVRGVRVAIDDFGTGYSSLSYLVRFPIDRLKIDRSFIANLEQHPGNQVIVNSIVEMTDRMKIDLMAEGVENPGQQHLLLESRCHYMQGYLFGRAMTTAEFSRLVAPDRFPA